MTKSEKEWTVEKKPEKGSTAKSFFRIVISLSLAFTGIAILLSQMYPLSMSYLQGKLMQHQIKILAEPVPESHKEFIQGEFAYYNPEISYFQNLMQAAGEYSRSINETLDPVTNEMRPIKINMSYSTPMYLTINSIGIDNVKIAPNVNSYDEEIYNIELKKGVAHFRGTPLPMDGGNTFIYGHSAVPSFFSNNQNLAETIFTRLDDVKIGDTIEIERDQQRVYYTVRKIKIVEPDDFSILAPQGTKETVTLMTCWPTGISAHRKVVIGERNG